MVETNRVAMLSMIAAAAESVPFLDDTSSTTHASDSSSEDGPRSPKSKLVLPELTPDVKKDLESCGASGAVPLSISKRPEWADYRLRDIAHPHPNDVLCGRGGGSNNHPGNEAFRVLVNEVKLPYVNCPKREKPLIARRIVEAVRNQSPPGRFLQKDAKSGMWNDIGDGKAREKTSQALREGAPVIRDMIGRPGETLDVATLKKKKGTKGDCEMKVVQDAILKASAGDGAQVERRSSMPPAKRFNAEHEFSNCAPWQQQRDVQAFHPPQPRGPSMMVPQVPQHHRRATMDYPPSYRYPALDSVPFETVRRLLLGHLDPVQLAYQILPPEDAAAVARRHFMGSFPGSLQNSMNIPIGHAPMSNNAQTNATSPDGTTQDPKSPLPLCSLVSDGSTSPNLPSEVSSCDDSSRSNSERAKAVLPKKRKFTA
jgi:hypothetical protein